MAEGFNAMKTPKTSSFALAIAAASGLLVGVTPASAQSALGGGNALDSNLSTRGRSNLGGNDFESELRFRNAIVTGNVPGGMAFRGDVGYRAAGDFTGGAVVPFNLSNANTLGAGAGSDDLFEFQTDSFYSGLAAQGVSGIDALQYQMRLQTGSLSGEIPVLPVIRRPSQQIHSDLLIGSEYDQNLVRTMDAYTIAPGTLRSTTEFLSNSYLDPTLLRAQEPSEGHALSFTVATPLRGITTQSAPTFTTDILTTDLLVSNTSRDVTEQMRSPNQISDLIEPITATQSYDNILQSLRTHDQVSGRPSELLGTSPVDDTNSPKPIGRIDFGIEPDRTLPGDSNLLRPGDPGATQLPSLTLEQRLNQLKSAMSPRQSQAINENDRTRQQVESTIEMLKGAQPVVSSFAPQNNKERDFFSEQMNIAQRMLQSGRWFDAEEHFASALSMRPGEALAAAGRVHAELGAALFLSAAVNLQKLLRENPGMIPVRYDESLMPNARRIGQVMDRLRQNTNNTNAMGRNSAFLLAYLGYQTNDQVAVREGFESIDRITKALGEEPYPFFEVVRDVWID